MCFSDLAQGSWPTGALASCDRKASFPFVFLISCVVNDFNVLFGAGVDIAGIPFGLWSLSLSEVSGNR